MSSSITLLSDCTTVAEFELTYGTQETIELSDLCDPLRTTIDDVKIQNAINLATSQLNSHYLVADDCGRALIKTNCKLLVLRIARFLLDTTKSRPHVFEDYQDALAQIKEYCSCSKGGRCPLTSAQLRCILGDDYVSTRATYRGYAGIGRRIGRIPDRSLVDRFSNTIAGVDKPSDEDRYTIDDN